MLVMFMVDGLTLKVVYLVCCYYVHMLSSKISMYNMVYMEVVKSRRHLRQEHDDVLHVASMVKYVLL